MPLTAQDVAEITRLLEQSDFLELRLEHEGFKLTLKRAAAAQGEASAGAMSAAAAPASWAPSGSAHPPGAAVGAALREPHGEERAPAHDPSLQEVTAPLLGIFYRAPRPGAGPYVEVGSEVQEDTVVGIIEVMKLMNSVRAEVRGTVVDILVEDGATVEYGQVLLRVSRGGESG